MEKKMANILERLTEGTVFQDKKRESAALVSKWEASGLLEGISDEHTRGSMAVLLENQAKELLREANSMSAGDVQGFASVAFPIVRRVFAGLIANDLVSVQPMSLPSGLVFFMDFKHGSDVGLDKDVVMSKSQSIYGDRVGEEIRKGVRLDGFDTAGYANVEKGFGALTSGYGTARISATVQASRFVVVTNAISASSEGAGADAHFFRYDPDLTGLEDNTQKVYVLRADLSALQADVPVFDLIAEQDLTSLALAQGTNNVALGYVAANLTGSATAAIDADLKVVRRLTRIVEGDGKAGYYTGTNTAGTRYLEVVLVGAQKADLATAGYTFATLYGNRTVVNFPIKDRVTAAGNDSFGASILGALSGSSPWTLEGSSAIPEIQLKVDSYSITARTRKLKASWTPELGQDLNAYHNLDAEVELTSILSEQIGLEIDQEILNDLIKGATGGVKYWSRRPGKFVNRKTGAALATTAEGSALPPDFFGNVSMWYETLLETINDVSADIHRKTLRGAANFIVVSPEVANILEFTAGFRATVTHDSDKGSTGAVKVGALNSKFDVIVDPYFPRNVILVGRKGSSFLESGYVYAPYVPLQTTPTIFDPSDFTPRKAVMTRYGKTMVRSDMYGLVVVEDLEG
jgi:hypothetical protein